MEENTSKYERLFQTIQERMQRSPVRTEKSNTFNIFRVLGIADKEVLLLQAAGGSAGSQRFPRIKRKATPGFSGAAQHSGPIFAGRSQKSLHGFGRGCGRRPAERTLSFT